MPSWILISMIAVVVAVAAAASVLAAYRSEESPEPSPAGSPRVRSPKPDTGVDAVDAPLPGASEGAVPEEEAHQADGSSIPGRPIPAGPSATALATHPVAVAITKQVSANTLRLPLFPRSAGHVLALCSDPEVSAEQITQAVQADPTLTAHLLGVANSSAYAPETPITSLDRAIVRLGIKAVRDMAVAVTMRERLFKGDAAGRHAERIMTHSAMTSAYAAEIAKLTAVDPTDASLAGLLHDVGRPALHLAGNDVAADLGYKLDEPTIYGIEGEHHELAGERLAASWSLPAPIAAAIGGHHDATTVDEEHREIASILQLADELAKWAERNDEERPDADAVAPAVSALGIQPVDYDRLLLFRARAQQLAAAYSR